MYIIVNAKNTGAWEKALERCGRGSEVMSNALFAKCHFHCTKSAVAFITCVTVCTVYNLSWKYFMCFYKKNCIIVNTDYASLFVREGVVVKRQLNQQITWFIHSSSPWCTIFRRKATGHHCLNMCIECGQGTSKEVGS